MTSQMFPYRNSIMSAIAPSPCPSRPAFRDAGRRPVLWREALDAFALLHGLKRAALFPLVPSSEIDLAPVDVLASPRLIERWRATWSAIPPAMGRAARPWRAVLVDPSDGDRHVSSTTARYGLDTEQEFFCLEVEAWEPFDVIARWRSLTGCLEAIAEGLDISLAIAHAETAMLVDVLAKIGAIAVVVAADGVIPKVAGTPFEGAAAKAVVGGAAGRKRRRGRREDGAAPFHLLCDASGERWVVYTLDLPLNPCGIVMGEHLLVAWPVDRSTPATASARRGTDIAERFGETFGLSKGEALLAAHVVDSDLRAAAERCGIAYETARSQLKSIFRRMGLGRQSELAALFDRFAFHADLHAGIMGRRESVLDPIG